MGAINDPSKTASESATPRLDYLDPNSIDPSVKKTFQAIEQANGFLPNLFKITAHYPKAVQPLFELSKAILHQSTIERRLQEIAMIRASVENNSSYCIHSHMDYGFKAGITHKQIDALRYNPSGGEFTEKEQIVIEYSDQVTRNSSKIPEELFVRLRTFFNESEIVNLTLIIGVINAYNRYSSALKLHPDH